MLTIAIANQKGGCGKTTTAVNMSAALAAVGRRVLLIDLDPQAHASFALRKGSQPPGRFIYDVLTDNVGRRSPLDSCITNISVNLDMVQASIELSTLEQELKDKEDAVSQLHKTLRTCPSVYEYILVDCPPSLGFLTFNALRAADRVIIPIDMSPFTLVGVGKLLGMIELVGMKLGHFPRVSALPTLFDKRTTYSGEILDEVKTFFGDRMLRTVIRQNVALKRAVSEGISIIDFDRACTGAKDYAALSDEILRLGPIESLEPDEREAAFTIEAPAARDVYVVGDFNDWKIGDESRLVNRENAWWEKRMKLAHGRYRYQFVVDGEWTPDSKNGERERNVFGTFDSIVAI
jgi:chromosome partitioning protein